MEFLLNLTNQEKGFLILVAGLVILFMILMIVVINTKAKDNTAYKKGIKLGHIDIYYDNVMSCISILEKSIDKEKDSDVLYIITEAKRVCKIVEQLNMSDKMNIFDSVDKQMESMDKILSTMTKKYSDKTVHDVKKEEVLNELAKEERKKGISHNKIKNMMNSVLHEDEEPETKFNIPDKVELPKSVAFNNDMISNLSNDNIE